MKSIPLKIAQIVAFIALLVITMAGFVLSVSVVLAIFGPDNPPLNKVNWVIPLKMEREELTDRVTYSEDTFEAVKIDYRKVYLEILATKHKTFFLTMRYLALLGVCIFGFLSNYFLFHILASVEANPFSKENLSRIKKLGLLVIGGEIYYFSISLFLSISVIQKIDIPGIEIAPIGWTDMNFGIIFLGIIILVIGEVFRQGSVLQENENLTV